MITEWVQNNVIEKLCESKGIAKIYGIHYNSHHQEAAETFNRTVQNFMTSSKDHQKDRYNLEESINDFLIYYNDREDLTLKVTPFRVIMNVKNKDLIHKILENTRKWSQKAKMLTETFFWKAVL